MMILHDDSDTPESIISGNKDEVTTWNRCLTSEEISSMYNLGMGLNLGQIDLESEMIPTEINTSEDVTSDLPWIWCLIANVTHKPHIESDSPGLCLGTKHFAPGAKLYVFPLSWGDGAERMRVLGRYRGGGPRLIDTIVATKWLENWRCKKIMHPHVVTMMKNSWDNGDESRAEIERFVEMMNGRSKADTDI